MQDQTPAITPPSLPKGGGAIQSAGSGLGGVGTCGAASFDIAVPLSAGRGYAPQLSLHYQSSISNGPFGFGWRLSPGCVARRTSRGVPHYDDDDVILGPDGGVWLAERGADGQPSFSEVDTYRDLELEHPWQVIRHFPRVEGDFSRLEHWRTNPADPGFWLIHGRDGSLHLYGRTASARHADPLDPQRVAEWLLEESMNAHGEHILYEYKAEDLAGLAQAEPRDFRARRYLARVCYGNVEAWPWLMLWQPDDIGRHAWHFELLLDYGERPSGVDDTPGYPEQMPWPVREDRHSAYAYGFELGCLRLCRQLLMFHRFPELGEEPVLVQRLLLEYHSEALSYQLLAAAHHQAWDADGNRSTLPPVEFGYSTFAGEPGQFVAFPELPGLNDGQRYQLVDLYGEGTAGVLYRSDQGWMYREPRRATDSDDPDAIVYDDWRLLPRVPAADSSKSPQQSLGDLTGDACLDWCVNAPGFSGCFTLDQNRDWSAFVPFSAMPSESLHPLAQLADLSGAGLLDLALIGPRSVRVYANRRDHGFAPAREVPHDEDSLPIPGNHRSELVALTDLLGSGQQHLVRIRHNEVRLWPNLGHGRFGRGMHLASLPFTYEEFDASRVLLADLDGSGAVDLIYLCSEHALVFMNRSGVGFEPPFEQPWPAGVRYDALCQVSAADLLGLGCASLVLTVPHMAPRHWRLDFVTDKPYLMTLSRNNMGAQSTLRYRSSAQEWLDEKNELQRDGTQPVCQMPLALHLVNRQQQRDEITGNQLTQLFSYRLGHYDRHERELRGYGLVLQTDSESASNDDDELFTAPMLTKTWYHAGQFPPPPLRGAFQDREAATLGDDLLSRHDPQDDSDEVIDAPDPARQHAMAHALSGSLRRVEQYGLDDDVHRDVPFSVQEYRYRVRELAAADPHQPYPRMLPMPLESVEHQYERQADDPRSQHSITLRADAFGEVTHAVVIHCARRRRAGDPPPFEDEHEQRWWRDAHDDAQYQHYLNESRARPIHLDDPQGWRLGLPWQARGNALVLPAAQLPVRQISYEHFSGPEGPLGDDAERHLTGQSVQRYQAADTRVRQDLPDGQASFEALPGPLESAELDETALQAYDRVMSRDELHEQLLALGYRRMPALLPEQPELELWSVQQGFTHFAPATGFHRTVSFRQTNSHGLTQVGHDPYWCQISDVALPDGCLTHAEFDYHSLQPVRIVDPNRNTQEARYDGFGRLLASSFHGTEAGQPAGFAPLSDYQRESDDLEQALADPAAALQNAASVCFYDPFNWMDRGQPVQSAVLLADRYPGDPELQIRISLTCADGFGRSLQSKQKVDPGEAWEVDEDGRLVLENGVPKVIDSEERWRVSERVEYNNKGLPVRVYRPYFANRWRYIDDSSLRESGYHDQQFYDPLGRQVRCLTAKGYLRRERYLPWYGISEDENDTWQEVIDSKERAS